MSEKPSHRRDQENIYLDKRSPLSSQGPHQRRDIRLAEDRVLQEAQQVSQANNFYFKANSQTQEYSTSSNNSGPQEKKASQQQSFQKGGDRELRQILKESTSPTTSVGTSDISYRIVNEILNTQNGNRSQYKMKMNNRIVERRKSPVQSPIENIGELIKDQKMVFEENEELRRVQEKISITKQQLEKKKNMLETNRRKYEIEIVAIEERDKKLKEDYPRLKEKIAERGGMRNMIKDRTNLNAAKETLRHLRAEYQAYEKEINMLRDQIERQERDKEAIEQKVAQGFGKQIQEFEEAIMSIEQQKMGIYAKLNEAMQSHNENLEQKAMLKEDLSGRLLQRADLVAEREELEQALEAFRANNKAEIEFYYFEMQSKQQVEMLDVSLETLYSRRDALKKQIEEISAANGEQERVEEEAETVDIEKLKEEWRALCEFEVAFSQKAEEMGISGFEDTYEEVLDRYGLKVEKENVWEYLQEINEGSEESMIEEIKSKAKTRDEVIEMWTDRVADKMKDMAGNEGDDQFIRLYEEYCERVNNFEDIVERRRIELEKREETSAEREELAQVEKEIKELEVTKLELESDVQQRKEDIEKKFIDEAKAAFEAYLEHQAETFEAVKEKYGPEAAEDTKQQHYREFIEIAQNNLMDRINQFKDLLDEVEYLEQTIKSNTDIVDEKILPLLQDLLPSIEEGSVLLAALKQQQMLLLETEDEVSGQLDYVLENRDSKIQRSHECKKYNETVQHPLKDLIEARTMLEKRFFTLRDELSKLESRIIEEDKLATDEMLEERKLQKEYKDVEKELGEMETIRRPRLRELETQLGIWDKEVKDLEKLLEQLEMQRLTMEQQFVEQNYLGEELYQNNTPVSVLNDNKPGKPLAFESKESNSGKQVVKDNVEKNKENRGRLGKEMKSKGLAGLTDIIGVSDENLDLSPIGRRSNSPKTRESNQNPDLFGDLNVLSQPGSPLGKDLMSTWNCFSPPSSALLLGDSQKLKGKLSAKKEKSRERDEAKKEEASYLKNYKKRLEQKQQHVTSNNEIPRGNTSMSLDTRTRSLPQAGIPNVGNPKPNEDVGFLTQHTSPKGPEALGRPPLGSHGRDSQNTQNLSKQHSSKGLYKGAEDVDKRRDAGPEEGVSMFSPKALTLDINSLKPQGPSQKGLQIPQSLKSMAEDQLRYKEFIKQNADLPGEDLARELFVEQRHGGMVSLVEGEDEVNARKSRNRKPLSVETSAHLNENNEGQLGLKQQGDISGEQLGREGNEVTMKRMYQNLHGIMGAFRRGLQPGEGRGKDEDNSRSKSTGIHGVRMKGKIDDSIGDKLTHRTRDDRSYGNIDVSETRSGMAFIRNLGSPLGRTEGRYYEEREALQDLKGKTISSDYSLQEVIFFDTINPLLQNSLVYKKFTNYQSLKRPEFDPLMSDLYPPEVCGYGVRYLRLHPNLDRIEVKHSTKPGIELTIPVEQILRPVVPQITMDILRVQKKIVESQHVSGHPGDKLTIADIFGDISTKALLAKRGVNSLNHGMEKYLNCSYYSFSILLEKNGKVEFVTSSYNVFKEWIHGINMLLKYKKQLSKLKYKLQKNMS